MKRIPAILIHGSLGSGKTTLVQSLLQSDTYAGSFVIENEFADIDVDTTTLETHEHAHENVYSIAGGCICCSSGEELSDALRMIISRDWQKPVIIETTGVASSVQLIQKLFLNPEYLEHFDIVQNVYVVDPLETTSEELLESHLLDMRLADLVVVTKTDLAKPESVQTIIETLIHTSPDSIVVESIRGAINPLLLQRGSRIEHRLVEYFKDLASFKIPDHGVTYIAHAVPPEVTREKVEEVIHALQKNPTMGLARAKGYFADVYGTWWHLEATRTQSEILKTEPKSKAVLVFIGSGVASIDSDIFTTSSTV